MATVGGVEWRVQSKVLMWGLGGDSRPREQEKSRRGFIPSSALYDWMRLRFLRCLEQDEGPSWSGIASSWRDRKIHLREVRGRVQSAARFRPFPERRSGECRQLWGKATKLFHSCFLSYRTQRW